MSMGRILLFSLGATICLLFKPAVGLACTCELPQPGVKPKQAVTQAREKAKAVFSGEVVEIIENPRVFYVEVRFRVESSWKQARTDELILRTGRGGGDCGYRFEVGEHYLVYAYGSDENRLETNICQRTKKLADAENDLKLLGKARTVSKSPKQNLRQTSNLSRCSAVSGKRTKEGHQR
jgi:hypothetical protein